MELNLILLFMLWILAHFLLSVAKEKTSLLNQGLRLRVSTFSLHQGLSVALLLKLLPGPLLPVHVLLTGPVLCHVPCLPMPIRPFHSDAQFPWFLPWTSPSLFPFSSLLPSSFLPFSLPPFCSPPPWSLPPTSLPPNFLLALFLPYFLPPPCSPPPCSPMLARFFVNLTQARVTWTEEISSENIPSVILACSQVCGSFS